MIEKAKSFIDMSYRQTATTEVAQALTATYGKGVCNQPADRSGILYIKEATAKGYAEAREGDSVNIGQPNSSTRRGRVGAGIANTLTCAAEMGTVQRLRIRRLTPRECFRLQGWSDEYFERARLVNSDAQLYKQAGNGVTVAVVRAIGESIVDAIIFGE